MLGSDSMGRRSTLPSCVRGVLAALAGGGLFGVASRAAAYETEVDASVQAQYYTFESPYDSKVARAADAGPLRAMSTVT